jgi:hypothetical protein
MQLWYCRAITSAGHPPCIVSQQTINHINQYNNMFEALPFHHLMPRWCCFRTSTARPRLCACSKVLTSKAIISWGALWQTPSCM